MGAPAGSGSSPRAADVRFLVPTSTRRAALLGLDEAWRSAFAATGATLVSPDAGPDLVVADRHRAAAACGAGAGAVLLLGGGAHAARRAGYVVRRFGALPAARAPVTLVPLDSPRVVRYALSLHSRGARARDRIAPGAISIARRVPASRTVLLATRARRAEPFVLGAASRLGVLPRDAPWFLSFGRGDDLQRAVFHVFRPGASAPSWVVKFGRVPGHDRPFLSDEAGLALVPVQSPARRHIPSFLGRTDVEGLPVSIETAAVGPTLAGRIAADRRPPLALLERVADWSLELAVSTRSGRADIAAELVRAAPTVDVTRLASTSIEVPVVAQHHDLGCWNIVAADDDFTVLDWESARAAGRPLWDLLYFAADAFARVDGATAARDLVDHAAGLFAGRSRWSGLVFRWIRAHVRALELSDAAVGPLATTCWLHHAASAAARQESLGAAGGVRGPAVTEHLALLASRWLADASLGVGWRAWR